LYSIVYWFTSVDFEVIFYNFLFFTCKYCSSSCLIFLLIQYCAEYRFSLFEQAKYDVSLLLILLFNVKFVNTFFKSLPYWFHIYVESTQDYGTCILRQDIYRCFSEYVNFMTLKIFNIFKYISDKIWRTASNRYLICDCLVIFHKSSNKCTWNFTS
jgi:hypothetical protein